jgi:hypothetical protein
MIGRVSDMAAPHRSGRRHGTPCAVGAEHRAPGSGQPGISDRTGRTDHRGGPPRRAPEARCASGRARSCRDETTPGRPVQAQNGRMPSPRLPVTMSNEGPHMPTGSTRTQVVLRAAGTAVLIDATGPDLPRVLHWGADVDVSGDDLTAIVTALEPGTAPSSLDAAWPLTVLPGPTDGWPGRPMLRVHPLGASGVAADRAAFPRWTATEVLDGPTAVTVTAQDVDLGVEVVVVLALDGAGVLAIDVEIRNTGSTPCVVDGVTPVLPVAGRAAELLDLSGRWSRERSPQRTELNVGVHARESWRGRPGFAGTPLLVAGPPASGSATARCGECTWPTGVAQCTTWSDCRRRRRCSGGRAAAARRGRAVAGGDLQRPDAARGVVRRRARRPVGPPAPTRPSAGIAPPLGAAAHAQHVGGHLLRPRPRPPHRAGRPCCRGGRGALRPRRRLVPRPSRRHERAGRLDCRPRRMARRPASARRPRPRAGPAVRVVGGAGDDLAGLRGRPRAPRVGGARALVASPVRARRGQPVRLCLSPGAARRADQRVRARRPQVGPQPRRAARRRARADRRRLPAARRAAGEAPRLRDRVLRQRRRPYRPGHARTQRSDLGQQLHGCR